MSATRTRLSDGLRWTACFVLVLGVHAAAAASLLARWQPADEPVAGGPPILIELSPLAAAPDAPPSEAAPGPQQMQAQQPAVAPAETPEPEKPQVTAAGTPPEEMPVEKTAPPAPVDTPPLPHLPPMTAAVTRPPPRRPHEAARPKEQRHQHKLADLNTAPPRTAHAAPRAVAPSPGAATHDPNAMPAWKSELVARLQRYKRYPSEAQARGEEGVAQLAFSVVRGGGVHIARIARSSGSILLDRATLDLLARAQPLPAPPPDIRGAQIAVVVPIKYNLRGAR